MQIKKYKIIFYGTPYFATHCLDHILRSGHEIIAVITAPDKVSGRGKKLKISSVKEYALKNKLNLIQPINLKDPEFISKIELLSPDIQIVVAFRMLPKEIWSIPKLHTINLHASLLPNYRGAAPINWVIINGEKETGLTTFIIDNKIDTGSILLSQKVKISINETAGSLTNKLLEISGPLINNTIDGIIDKSINPISQILNKDEKEAPKLNSNNLKINWNDPLEKIEQQIRGLSPSPGAWTNFTNNDVNERMKIIKANIINKNHNNDFNKILVKNSNILISLKGGYINFELIQLPNKKVMTVKALLNGYKFNENAKVF